MAIFFCWPNPKSFPDGIMWGQTNKNWIKKNQSPKQVEYKYKTLKMTNVKFLVFLFHLFVTISGEEQQSTGINIHNNIKVSLSLKQFYKIK